MDWVKEFKLPIGFLLSTFLLFFLGLISIFRFSSFEKRKLKVMEADSERVQANSDAARSASLRSMTESGAASSSDVQIAPTALAVEGGETGLARLRSLVKSDIEIATYLVRLWIRNPSEGAAAALLVVPSALSFEAFFQNLLTRLNKGRAQALETADESNAYGHDCCACRKLY